MAGDDTLYSKGGQSNTLAGGSGNDTFVVDQVSGPALPDTGVVVLKDIGGDPFNPVGGTPTSITYITDFEAGNSQEKIDLSGFTLTELYVRGTEDADINGENINGAVIYAFNGTQSQMIILKDAKYEDLIEDNFILPSSFSHTNIKWQVIGSSENNILSGSSNNDTIFGLGGSDVLVGGVGDDVIYGTDGTPSYYVVAKNAGDSDSIYNFNGFYHTYHWFLFPAPLNQKLGITGDNIVEGLTSSRLDKIDLRQFADVRNFEDLSISFFDVDGDGIDDKTIISLPDNQSIVLNNFGQGYSNLTYNLGYYNNPEYGIVGDGYLFQLDSYDLLAESFTFYNGTLTGTDASETLEGGYGVDAIMGNAGDDVITGKAGNDTLDGGAGNDTLTDGSGNDTMTGGDHGDTFVIGKEASATDTITDFEYWRSDEKIDLSAFNVDFVGYAALLPNISQQGADTHINLGNSQILVLQNMDASKLSYKNFTGNVGASNDMYGTTGDDQLQGQATTTGIYAGAGNDYVYVGNITDLNGVVLDGGADNDCLVSEGKDLSGAIISNFETLVTGWSPVTLTGVQLDTFGAIWVGNGSNEAGTYLYTAGAGVYDLSQKNVYGQLHIYGSAADETFKINERVPFLNGGDGYDTLKASGLDISGVDISNIEVLDAENLAVTLTDTQYASFSSVINDANINILSTMNTMTGTAGDDTLQATDTTTHIVGLGGHDQIDAGPITIGIDGGAGWDRIYINRVTDPSALTVDGGADHDVLVTGAQDLTGMTISNVENLTMGWADVTMTADQMAGFGSIWYGNGQVSAVGAINASAAGTYDLSNKTIDGTINLNGSAGNDTLISGSEATMLTGGLGNDQLTGNAGNDTYVFNRGDGADTILDYDTTAGNADVLSFGANIAKDQLWFAQDGNDLRVSVLGTSDGVVVDDWYSGSANEVESMTTSGGYTLDSQLQQLVSAMASYAANDPGFDPISASAMPTDQTLQNAIAASWHT